MWNNHKSKSSPHAQFPRANKIQMAPVEDFTLPPSLLLLEILFSHYLDANFAGT